MRLVDSHVLEAETEQFVGNEAQTDKSTVGLMVQGCVVHSTLAGAPAALCGRFQKGDRVAAIDGTPATPNNIIPLLVGSDKPGSIVTITVDRASGSPEEVALKRACTADLADRRRMFDMFTVLKKAHARPPGEEGASIYTCTFL